MCCKLTGKVEEIEDTGEALLCRHSEAVRQRHLQGLIEMSEQAAESAALRAMDASRGAMMQVQLRKT